MADRGRPFGPGNTMGRGRPKGSRNKVTQEARDVLQTHAVSVVRKGISLALQGDTRMLATLMNRVLGPQTVPTKFGNIATQTVEDLMKTSASVAQKLGAGEITPEEAHLMDDFIERRRKLIETHDLEKRLRAIEQAKSAPSAPPQEIGPGPDGNNPGPEEKAA